MSALHTPGPWTVYEGRSYIDIRIRCPHGTLAATDSAGAMLSPEEIRANANVIAAAPELLAALEGISGNKHLCLDDLVYTVREREGRGWDGPAVKKWGKACGMVKAAIAKAKGQS